MNNEDATSPGRGRGRSCGRNGGKQENSVKKELELVRQSTRISKRALEKMPASARVEHQARILEQQGERTLLPDAPPRKHARIPVSPYVWTLPLNTGGEKDTERDTVHNIIMRPTSPSSISESEHAEHLFQATTATTPQLQAETARPHDDPDQQVLEWLEQQQSDDDDNIANDNEEYTADEPAHLPDVIDDDCVHFLQTEDDQADRMLTELLTNRDRTEQITFDWTNDKDAFLGQRENFVGPSGPTFPLETTDRPIDVFLKYFDDEVLDLIVTETNRNCNIISNNRSFTPDSRFSRLKPTDRSEMYIFFAILILQGLLPLPVESDYFRENGFLTLKYFKTLMTHNRFVMLKRILHFTDDDDTTTTIHDRKLGKFGPLLNLLRSRFKGLYLPSRDIVIDESLLKWHGRLNFAQKIATKAAKVGIKTYELCESSTGYCWNFFIYTGKGHTHNGQDRQDTDRQQTERQDDTARQDTDRHDGQDDTDRHDRPGVEAATHRQTDRHDRQEGTVTPTNLTAQIVLDLVRPLLNRGHKLVMDNFYNSPLLARYLKQNGTDCFGTLRVNREFVPEVIKNTTKSMLRQGEIIQSYCRDLSALVWRDTNLVAMLSTCHPGEVGRKEKYSHHKYKPQVVLDYNLAMGGVDRKDQLLSSHTIERKRNQVWYKKVFRRLLNVSVLNSYIIYKTQHPRISQREFRTALANQLIAKYRQPQIERPLDDHIVKEVTFVEHGLSDRRRPILAGNHFVGSGPTRFVKCVFCRKSRTKYICKQCNVSLCLEPCFESYHTLL